MPIGRRLHTRCRLGISSVMIMILAVPCVAQMLPGPVPEKDDPVAWTNISVGARVHCPGMGWPTQHEGAVFSNFFRIDFSGSCSANGGPGASGSFPARHGGIAWSGGFSDKWQTTTWLSSAHTGGKSGTFPYTAYPIDRVLIYDPDRVIRQCDHYMGGCPPAAYDTSQGGLLPGRLPASVLLFDWGQLRPVYEPALELTEKPYLKDPTRPDEENLDSIFLLRDDMTVLSGDGILSDANGWWTAWFGRGDLLLTRLRPNAFTLPGYDPPDDALSDSPPVEIAALDMNPWLNEVMSGYPDLYEPLKLTYSPPLGNRVRNDPDNDRRAQVWLQPDYEPQRAPYTIIGQAYQFPLVTGALHTADADICPLTQDAEGNETCVPHPYFGSDAPQAGLPPAERATPVYTFPAPESPDEESWLELSATWWDTRTKEEQQAQSGNAGGVEIAHPKGILTSLSPNGDSSLAERLHWRLVTPSNRPDLLETLPATMASEPFTRLVPHARLKISEPGVYDVELSIVGDEGGQLMLDTMQIQVLGVDLDAHWPGAMAEPGPLVSDAEENDALNLIASVNDDDDNDDDIIDNDRAQSPTILPEDDDVMTFVIRALAVNPGVGTLELFAGDGLHFFTADGMQELSLPLSVDLAHPTGPLADAVNAEHPQDVTLLVEANLPVERTRVELIYSRDGAELRRDEIHLRVIQPTIKGGFTRGSVRYSEAVSISGEWFVFRDFGNDRPLSVLLPDPIGEDADYRYIWYRKDLGGTQYFQEWKKDGYLIDAQYFKDLAAQWNAVLDRFHIPFLRYQAEDIVRWLSEATGISEDILNSGRYFTTGLIEDTGQYEIKLLDQDQAQNPDTAKIKIIKVKVMIPGQIDGRFRMIGDDAPPYMHEEPLTLVSEDGDDFFRTLGGMRLHLEANLSPVLTAHASHLLSATWYGLPRNAEFVVHAESFPLLDNDLKTQGVPQALREKLRELLVENTFHSKSDLLQAIKPAFEGYTMNDGVVNVLQKYVEEGRFPPEFAADNLDDGLNALRPKQEGRLQDVTYWSTEQSTAWEHLLTAMKETTVRGKPNKYAIRGYRFTRGYFSALKDVLPDPIYEKLNAHNNDTDGKWKIWGTARNGWTFRNIKDDKFYQFIDALKKVLTDEEYETYHQTIMEYTDQVTLFGSLIRAAASHAQYYEICREAIVRHVAATGQLYPGYRTTLDHFTLTDYALEKLKETDMPEDTLDALKEILRNQEFPTKEAFLKALTATIGEEQTTAYKIQLLKYAKEAPPLARDELSETYGQFAITMDTLKALETAGLSAELLAHVGGLKGSKYATEEDLLVAVTEVHGAAVTLEDQALLITQTAWVPATYWQGASRTDLDETVTMSLTLKDDNKKLRFISLGRQIKSRVLQLNDPLIEPLMEGDDVSMLQAFLRQMGVSHGPRLCNLNDPDSNCKYGDCGTIITIDGKFGKDSEIAVNRLRKRDEIGETGSVDLNMLKKIQVHRTDYLAAFEAYSSDSNIDTGHQNFKKWIEQGAAELGRYYDDAYVTQVVPNVQPKISREELLETWVKKEASKGHWGRKIPFRIVIGECDSHGSIGFSQVQNRYKYGASSADPAFNNVNLYHPVYGIKGFAVFSNDAAPAIGGGGFKRAFDGNSPEYLQEHDYSAQNEYPQVGNVYKDDAKDLLSKAIMAYNRGSNLPWVKDHIWPEALRKYETPTANTPHAGEGLTRWAIHYTLTIQQAANIQLTSWLWTAQRIHTGADGKCDTTIANGSDDEQIMAPGTQGVPNQACIAPGENGILDTITGVNDDQIQTFDFVYREEEWLAGKAWHEKLHDCALLANGCQN